MAVKLDMSKAYDRLEWVFIEAVLRGLGFAEEWIKLIMMCISSVSYSVLINGEQCGFFGASCVIRQGDSLSPYLFLLCAEGLSHMLRKAVLARRIFGVAASRGGSKISHLFFADDSLLFCQATLSNCVEISKVLKNYEEASGQQLNRAKTSIFFTKNTSLELKAQIQAMFQVPEIKSYEKYLGLPSFVGRSKVAAFGDLKGRVWRQINGWKERLLSHGGREVLIKAVAQSIPTYTMSCFSLPDGLCKDLNKMFSQFWWGYHDKKKKAHWLKWSKLCDPKDRGGMSFRDIKAFNWALLVKQGWRFLQNPQSLVARVFKAKYFPGCGFMEAGIEYRASYAWRSIASARGVLKLGLSWHIGNGESVRITEDTWLPMRLPESPNSIRDILDKNERVSTLIKRGYNV